MSRQDSRVYKHYNRTCGLGPAYFKKYLEGTACLPTLEYYYKLYEPDGTTPVYSLTQNSTNNGSYSGIATLFGTNKDYTQFNTNQLFTFLGTKNPSKTISAGVTIPSVYYEVIRLQVEPFSINDIEGVVKYLDESDNKETSVDKIELDITVAEGIFNGYTKMTIFINNNVPDHIRKVIIQ